MPQQPTVAIIGAGSSGIAAVKALHERGLAFDCFEASDRVGGNWVFGNRNGMSAAYRDLHINSSRERMAFSDFPMPASCPDYPHHSDIAACFESYVEHFRFELLLRAYSGPPERYGLQKPDHAISAAHPTVSGRILDRIAHGSITPRPNIARLGSDCVQFTDGTRVHADGAYRLPSRARMLADIRRRDAAVRRRYVASPRHTIQGDFDRYVHELERERGRGARRARAAGLVPALPARAARATGAAGAERTAA
jgi:hypothetical protein